MNTLLGFLSFLPWALAFVVAPIMIGIGVCRLLRVKEYGGQLAAVLFSVFLAFLPFARKVVQTEYYGYRDTEKNEWVSAVNVKEAKDTEYKKQELTDRDIKRDGTKWVLQNDPKIEVFSSTTYDIRRLFDAIPLGIDLAGGTNLVYELDDKDREGNAITAATVEKMIGAVNRRINPAGTKETVVRRVGQNRIEVILPGADPAVVAEIKDQMTRLGTLEFSIVCNRIDHKEIIELGEKTKGVDVLREGNIVAKWRPVKPEVDDKGNEIEKDQFSDPQYATRRRDGKLEVLVQHESNPKRQVNGEHLARAYSTRDRMGAPAVGFNFDSIGSNRFGELTSRWRPTQDGRKRQLAILLDDEVVTAPSLNDTINGQGIIEGRFTEKQVNKLVAVLNAGALPVKIKKDPISEFTISPTLGSDVQSKGKSALIVASVAVIVFMAGYYFIAGMIADLALLLNLLFIVSVMVWVKAAFTLPGLAGLVLSAGMAVDANVLIYERMREELARGASLRMAIHNGFDKAFVAIFDSNVSTLITAIILFSVGTETVKGFAVSLVIGLLMNLYTAVYISRLVMNILERSRTIRQVKMMGLIPVMQIDFVGKQMIASLASLVVIVVGMAAFFMRGEAKYDIDFTGGASVTMQFNDVQRTEDVRQALEKAFNSTNVTVEELSPSGTISKGRHFRLRIANEGNVDIRSEEVEKKIGEAFPGKLIITKLETIGEIEAIASGDEAAKLSEKEAGFAGGHKTQLKFSNELATNTFSRYFKEQVEAIQAEGRKKYEKADGLFLLEGTDGTGMSVAEGKVRIFNGMRLYTSSAVSAEDLQTALVAAQKTMDAKPLFDETTTFESSVANETKQSALVAIVMSLIALVAYVWFRFENFVFGLAAVVALAHDVLVTLGCVSLAGYLTNTPIGPLLMLNDFKINMAMIAAFLTIVGYSLNDTIVIFDRLREIRGKNPTVTKDMINVTVNQCLSRTILTALTVFITVVILYVMGGEGIHGFAFCMVIGSIAGTYSTVYIASPLVLVFMKRFAPSPAGSSSTKVKNSSAASPA